MAPKMDVNEQAVLNWVNSFAPEKPVESMIDLADGLLLSTILHKIAGEHFPLVKDEADYACGTRVGNVERILVAMKEYYRRELSTEIDTHAIDIQNLTRDCPPRGILTVLELVIGIAVQCPVRKNFISPIFSLDLVSQTFLLSLIDNILSGNHSCINKGAIVLSSNDNEFSAEKLSNLQEMVQHLQAERQRLIETVTVLSLNNTSLREQIEELGESSSKYEDNIASAQNEISAAQVEINNLKLALNKKENEITASKDALRSKGEELNEVKAELKEMVESYDRIVDSRDRMAVELTNVRTLLDETSDSDDDITSMAIASLKEKLLKLEFQLQQLKFSRNANDDDLERAKERIEYLEGQLRDRSLLHSREQASE